MPAATLFNAYVSTSAVSAAASLGLLDAVREDITVNLEDFGEHRGLDVAAIHAVAEVLAQQGVLGICGRDPMVLAAGPEFEDFWRNKGFFTWLVGGYGDMLSRVSELTCDIPRGGVAQLRDGGAIAEAGKDYGRVFVDPVVDDLIDGLAFTVMADLGCGSANRLIRLAERHPDKRFVGVELDRRALQIARDAVRAAGLSDRIEIVQDDVRCLGDRPQYADVDALVSFFLAHDLWPRDACLASLARIRECMPRVAHFLLCDTYLSPPQTSGDKPIFTMAFELTHVLMGHHVPTLDEWLELIDDSVWSLRDRSELRLAYSEVFHLAPSEG